MCCRQGSALHRPEGRVGPQRVGDLSKVAEVVSGQPGQMPGAGHEPPWPLASGHLGPPPCHSRAATPPRPRHAPCWIFTSHVWLGTLKFIQRKLDEKSSASVPLVTLQALRSHRRLLTAPRESVDRDDFPHDGTFSRTARHNGALSLMRRLHRLPPGADPFSRASWALLTSGSWGNSETYVKVITSTLDPPPPRSPPWQCHPFHPLPVAHPQPRPVCPSSLCFWECGALFTLMLLPTWMIGWGTAPLGPQVWKVPKK